ncbi:hypothetical protein [Aeromonas phage yong1]|uniref:Uncharacterized protein n=1 Tax=Aeromonas phage yong1 TaxID=2924882 RepID=A0A9X9E907_9CAUD|nr:hypothetical protein [Aeromonas phage yong1]
MGKYLKPRKSDIFGGACSVYVEITGLTKGQAKRKLRHAGCGRIVEVRQEYLHELVQAHDNHSTVYGRAYRGYCTRAGGPCWTVHIAKK